MFVFLTAVFSNTPMAQLPITVKGSIVIPAMSLLSREPTMDLKRILLHDLLRKTTNMGLNQPMHNLILVCKPIKGVLQ
jgi:hypothetical protein